MEEKIQLKNYVGESLSGVLEKNISGPVIIFLHGFCGNKDENGLFSRCAEYFTSRNLNSFRFDFSGINESEGRYEKSSLKKQASELDAAVEKIASEYPFSKIGVLGFSLGAAVALYSMNPSVRAYSFWSPAFFPNKDMFPRYDSAEIRDALNTKGYFENKGVRVGSSLLEDIKTYNTELSLVSADCPIQIIHGTADPRINYISSIAAAKMINSDKELILIEGANHSFKDNESHRQIAFSKSADWFLSRLNY
jgi:alpha-beta hydrolase superfamily lysophospholipase